MSVKNNPYTCSYYFKVSCLGVYELNLCNCASDLLFIFIIEQVGSHEAIICVLAAQIANLGESIIGAALQEKEGFKWVGL